MMLAALALIAVSFVIVFWVLFLLLRMNERHEEHIRELWDTIYGHYQWHYDQQEKVKETEHE